MAKKHTKWEQAELDFDQPLALPEVVRVGIAAIGMELFLGIDPGEGCGLAMIGYVNLEAGERCEFIGSGTYTPADLEVMLRHNLRGVRRVGCEEYRLYSGSAGAQSGSNLLTSRVIGAVESQCKMIGVPLDMQPASIKNPAAAWARQRWPGIDLSYFSQHEKDAKAHAIWQVRQVIFARQPAGSK